MRKWSLRILFILSALLSSSAFIASTTFAQNTGTIWTSDSTYGISQQKSGDYALNLSHIVCVGNSVEVHFVLLGTVDGDTISNLTYNYGTISPGNRNGNVVHFTDYIGGGYIEITSASVTVNGQTVSLHNPSAYSGNYNCAPATNTPTDPPTNTPTDAPTNTPTNTPTDTPTNTPTSTPTDSPTSTATSTATQVVDETPVLQPTLPPTATTVPTATSTTVPTATSAPTETPVLQPTVPPTATSTIAPTATTAPTATSPIIEPPILQPTVVPTNTLAPTNTLVPTNTVVPTNTLVPTRTNAPSLTATTGPTSVPQKAPVTGGPSSPALLQAGALIMTLISIGSFVLLQKKVD